MISMRLRARIPDEELKLKVGKILSDIDYNVKLTGPAEVLLPGGQPLCVYLPGVLSGVVDDDNVYQILHNLYTLRTTNRGLASASPRFSSPQNRSYSRGVSSAIVGAVDPGGQRTFCRLTAWTGRNLPSWKQLNPLLRAVSAQFEEHVPERFAAQKELADQTNEAWVVEGTPFTTITVNNTYPTGVHTDKGDLDKGFSTIACIRKGTYTGGDLIFPEWRVAVNMKHGDLILMDAHQWHGNTAIFCQCGNDLNGFCATCGAERISVVSYFRTKIVKCGTPEDEYRTAVKLIEEQNARTI
jgi:hypothetical protein